ncbi:M23 family metallopeptidase [Kaistella palustris]|uniref:M23 family metallopeptidase n=1 Tax=Kaistella palustris TaxID=493376 RepID=UPI000426E227|nr:M23 family metallopeptidase [Kaistella palustris]
MRYLYVLLITLPFLSRAQKNIDVTFYHEKIGNEMQIFADNHTFAPVSAEYTYAAENMTSSLLNKAIIIIPAKTDKFKISTVAVADSRLKSSFSYDVGFVLGDITDQDFDENYVYSLPFAKQKTYLIFQGYNGKFSHQKANSIDFSLKENDQVLAARAGKVVEVESGHSSHCPTIDCAQFNNKVIILHSDGTMAEYVHLKKNGVAVQLGDQIAANQFIAYSGNTGFTKGPHLHFSVFKNNIDGSRTYFKTKFRTSKSGAALLEEGKSYTKNY